MLHLAATFIPIYLNLSYTTKRLVRQLRPYTLESTRSRPIPEVKQAMARSVLRWETTWEYRVS